MCNTHGSNNSQSIGGSSTQSDASLKHLIKMPERNCFLIGSTAKLFKIAWLANIRNDSYVMASVAGEEKWSCQMISVDSTKWTQ